LSIFFARTLAQTYTHMAIWKADIFAQKRNL